jgi:hypothetical protein
MRRWSIIVLFWAALLLGVYALLSFERARRLSRPEVAGWDGIHACGSLTSFDGAKTLDLDRSHKVRLTEKTSDDDDAPERTVDGTWSFEADTERYTISFEEHAASYTLVKPEDSSVCILAPGEVGAVNLRESWFAPKDE